MSPIAITGILAIDHVGIAVPDLAAAITFYQGAFNAQVLHQEENQEQGVVEAMLAIGSEVGSNSGTLIQLLAPLTPDSAIARFLDKSGAGMQQLAFRVEDVRQAAAQARALHIRTLYEEPKRGTHGWLVNFLHPKDCGGVLIELIEEQ
ncbi:MAG: methylmalonyl-CoA epimerase [Actinobacteria bacterium]|nr:methylmalonyl-CoA epimerase [Actinomycetota bacterium]